LIAIAEKLQAVQESLQPLAIGCCENFWPQIKYLVDNINIF